MELGLTLLDSKPEDDSNDAFRREEAKKRDETLQQWAMSDSGDAAWSQTRLFFSHCWREASTQERKRMLFAAMTNRGGVFWADFLDLWDQDHSDAATRRREITDEIRTTSKFVALIDAQYLRSFHCLEELECAVSFSKAVVVAVLDQEAWNLLTIPGGAKDAWNMLAPERGARSLGSYEGQEFGPSNQPFDLTRVEHIFTTIASINFCPCRELDFAALGPDGVATRLCTYVEKDLQYTKEHAFLQHVVKAWEEADRPSSLLLEGGGEVKKWSTWAFISEKAGSLPPVTALQSEYLNASAKRSERRRTLLKILEIRAVIVILLLTITAFAFLGLAVFQQKVASYTIARADLYAASAETNSAYAERQQRIAAAMLLATSAAAPETSSQIRAVVRAAEIAEGIGFTALLLPRLQAALEHLARLQYWIIDMAGHSSPVYAVTYSPDGLYLASGGLDKTVRIRSIPQGEGATGLPPFRIEQYLEAPGAVESLSWSPSGKLLAAGLNHEGNMTIPAIVIWRLAEPRGCWEELFRIPADPKQGKTAVKRALAWSPDSEILASGNDAYQQAMWYIGNAIRSGLDQPYVLMPKYGDSLRMIRAIAFSPNGEQIAIGGTNDEALVYGISDMASVVTDARSSFSRDYGYTPVRAGIAVHESDINSLAFSPDSSHGTLLAAGGDSGTFCIYNVSSANMTLHYSVEPDRPSKEFQDSPGSALEMLESLTCSHDSYDRSFDNIDSVAWSASGDIVGSASQDKKVRLYRKVAETGGSDMLGEDSFQLFAVLDALDQPHALAMPPATNAGLVSAALSSNSVRTWKPSANLGRNGPEWFDLDCSKETNAAFGDKFAVRGASISPNGNSFVASSYQGYICVWERQGNTWNVSAVLDFPQHPDYNQKSRRWPAREVRFSPSGDRFLAGDDAGGVHGWQRTSSGWNAIGSRYSSQAEEHLRAIAWSWDENWVASGGTACRVWNIGNKESELQELQGGNSAVHSAAWRNDLDEEGCYILATGETANVLRIRQLCSVTHSNGTASLVISAVLLRSTAALHKRDINVLAWSSTGILASGSNDGMLVIHTYKQGNVTHSMPLPGHSSSLTAIAWAPNGKELATSAVEDMVIVWDLRSDQTGQGRGYTSWVSKRPCQQLTWLDQEPRRLLCGRPSESCRRPFDTDQPSSYSLMYSLIDFSHQLSIMRELQYGSLDAGDLISLGLDNVAGTGALDRADMFAPPTSEATSATCPSRS